jgi:hypothetical protein
LAISEFSPAAKKGKAKYGKKGFHQHKKKPDMVFEH